MPSHLISAKIRGIRSYSPREDKTQAIDFMPLTLIVGKNGTGKTTIIEALKFIIAGEEPPHSDSRRNFIHAPRNDKSKMMMMANEHNYACIEIEFKNGSGDTLIARREISQAGTTGRNSTPAISSGYKVNKGSWVTVHRQDDWARILPKLFGLPNQAILSHVILCHQEDNLWCLGESYNVKQIFDKIFGCEHYKKEIKYIDDEIKTCKRDIQLSEKDNEHHGESVKRKKLVTDDLKRLRRDLKESETKEEHLEKEVRGLMDEKKKLTDKIEEMEASSRQITSLHQRIKELSERDVVLNKSLKPLLDRSKSVAERRPPPPPPPPFQPRKAKRRHKPEQDPTAIELGNIAIKVQNIKEIVSKLPKSDDLESLKKLIDEVEKMIEEIKNKFTIQIEEQEKEEAEEESQEEMHRKWYEQHEAMAKAAEMRRIEEDRKFRESIESSIQSNIKAIEEARRNLDELEKKVNSASHTNGLQEQLKEVEQKLVTVRDKKSMTAGSRMQMEREISKLQAEVKNYWRANISYAESLGNLVCNKTIQSDLEKLKLCFIESISSFHDQMLTKINEALRSRWRQIYQGTDIDSIEVVAEEITRGKDKKSYNYFMAMRKGGSRMKMREKSSAGQRALASIILRMTLAELFVRDFTFIALDEPTANLDLSNVQALAKSIGSYVRRRTKKGANIQWIIITHDEEFLRALDEESSPFFYRIQMNSDGYSEIAKVSSKETNLDDNLAESQRASSWKAGSSEDS